MPTPRPPVAVASHPDGRVAVQGLHGRWTVHLPGGHVQIVPDYMITTADTGWRAARVVVPPEQRDPCPRCGAVETNNDEPLTCAGCGERRATDDVPAPGA